MPGRGSLHSVRRALYLVAEQLVDHALAAVSAGQWVPLAEELVLLRPPQQRQLQGAPAGIGRDTAQQHS